MGLQTFVIEIKPFIHIVTSVIMIRFQTILVHHS
jgi:hypothetical protein